MDELLLALRAVAEPTRLRVLQVLAHGELTVSELCRVLGQSQPRVSRHLRVLTEAGFLDRQSQGASVFYRPARSGVGRGLLEAVLDLCDPDHPVARRDLGRLAQVRADRAEAAASYFESIASQWDALRRLHIADEEVEAALLEAVADMRIRTLLDVGTGTGRVLELFADRIEFGIGIDPSAQMLAVARSRLDESPHCTVRRSDVYDLDIEPESVDVVVLHHVLHFLDDPAGAIEHVLRTLRPGGRLLLVDFASHGHEPMRIEFAHRWLGFDDDDVRRWCAAAGASSVGSIHLEPSPVDGTPALATVLWVASTGARQASPVPASPLTASPLTASPQTSNSPRPAPLGATRS